MDLRAALLAVLLSSTCLTPSPVWAVALTPAPMLATSLRGDIDVRQYLVSEKLDGVRARWDGRRLLTRNGDPILVPAWFTAGWPATPLDGELWLGRGCFQQISDLVRAMRPDTTAWRTVRFMAFDLPADPAPFAQRATRLQALVAATAAPHLHAIAQSPVDSRAALDARLRSVLKSGGEGLMLHHMQARYQGGRSDALLKYKPVADAEARVIGYRPGRGKYAGLVGAVLVEDDAGRRFALGSGLSDADRRHPPPVGTRITYRYNGVTAHGTPRFARYLRVRADTPDSRP